MGKGGSCKDAWRQSPSGSREVRSEGRGRDERWIGHLNEGVTGPNRMVEGI